MSPNSSETKFMQYASSKNSEDSEELLEDELEFEEDELLDELELLLDEY